MSWGDGRAGDGDCLDRGANIGLDQSFAQEVSAGNPGWSTPVPVAWDRPSRDIHTLEATITIPKYYLVKREILDVIEDLPTGAVIPTERELASTLGTSRTTVRQAISELVAEGRLNRVQGRGTFVENPRMMQLPHASFSANAAAEGMTAGRIILDFRCEPSHGVVNEKLGLPDGSPVSRLDVLRTVDGEPLAHETVHLPGDLAGLTDELTEGDTLYEVLRESHGIDIVSVEDVVETMVSTDPGEARLLGRHPGIPLLVIHRTAFDAGERPVEWTRSVFRGDRFSFVSRRRL